MSCLSKILHLILEIYLQSLAVYLKWFLSQSSYSPIWTPRLHYFQKGKTSRRSLNKFFVLHFPKMALSEVCANWKSRFGLHFERWTQEAIVKKEKKRIFLSMLFSLQNNHRAFTSEISFVLFSLHNLPYDTIAEYMSIPHWV